VGEERKQLKKVRTEPTRALYIFAAACLSRGESRGAFLGGRGDHRGERGTKGGNNEKNDPFRLIRLYQYRGCAPKKLLDHSNGAGNGRVLKGRDHG